MKREEKIIETAKSIYSPSSGIPQSLPLRVGFIEGAKWADENPDKNLVYTKQELLDMGFGFDLNGNISTPQEIEERSKKYINYRKNKWIEKACEWLRQQEEMIGVSFEEDFIERFKKEMEE